MATSCSIIGFGCFARQRSRGKENRTKRSQHAISDWRETESRSLPMRTISIGRSSFAGSWTVQRSRDRRGVSTAVSAWQSVGTAASAAQLKTRSVTLDLVNQAGDALVEDNEHFAFLWDYVRLDRRRFIVALCHKEAEGPDLLHLGVIQERLLRLGIEVDDDTLISDLEFLRELEFDNLAGESSSGYYTLAVPLMGMWIDKQQDFVALTRKARGEAEDQYG